MWNLSELNITSPLALDNPMALYGPDIADMIFVIIQIGEFCTC